MEASHDAPEEEPGARSTGATAAGADEVRIRIRLDGPYVVTGSFVLTDHEGNVLDCGDRPNVALCRCGHSGSRPFCDGTHRQIGFDGRLRS